MVYNMIGKDELKLSNFCLGTWAFASDGFWGEQDETNSKKTILTALDRGINFFDTAEMYGDGAAEEVLGRALKSYRNKAIIASKVRAEKLGKDDLIKACEQSLKRLQTDYLDLYQIHWPNNNVPMEETYEAMDKLVKDGKVRNIGVCNFGVGNLSKILKQGDIVTNQLPYSLLWRAIEHDIIPECKANNLGILAYSSLGQGLLSGKYKNADQVPKGRTGTRFFASNRSSNSRHGESGLEIEVFNTINSIQKICENISQPMLQVALSWVLSKNSVTSVIVGARTPEQLTDTLNSVELNLSQETINELDQVTKELKDKVGKNPDMWEGKNKSRFK